MIKLAPLREHGDARHWVSWPGHREARDDAASLEASRREIASLRSQ
jgi:hypothetical protein